MKKILLGLACLLAAFSLKAQNTLYFDGKDDYVSAEMNFKFSKPFALEAWIITSKKTGWQPVFGIETSNSKYVGDFFSIGLADKNIAAYIWDKGQSKIDKDLKNQDTLLVFPGRRHHIAALYDGKEIRLFLDARLVAVQNLKLKPFDNGLAYIGGAPQGNYFSGTIDNIKIWKRGFTDSDVPALMYGEMMPDGLEVYYPFNQSYKKKDNTKNNLLFDFKGDIHGDLHNFGLQGDSSNWVLLEAAKSDILINLPSPAPSELKIGDIYQGGMVFYIDRINKFGLVCTLENQVLSGQTSFPWSNQMGMYSITGAKEKGIGKGQENTKVMLKHKGRAAAVCNNLQANGQTDWYLPSLEEMELMYKNLYKTGLADFSNGPYWTSTEDNLAYAWGVNFKESGKPFTTLKRHKCYIRAIRIFEITE